MSQQKLAFTSTDRKRQGKGKVLTSVLTPVLTLFGIPNIIDAVKDMG
jgi:hypothetical protein